MDARTVAGIVASGRMAVGVGLVLAPGRLTRPWVGAVADTTGGRVLSAGFGARDFAIGAGTLRALQSGGSTHEWLVAGMLTDATDLVATFAGRRSLPPLGAAGVCALAATGVVVGFWAERRLSAAQLEP